MTTTAYNRLQDATWLRTQYCLLELTLQEIADALSVAVDTVRRALERCGIPRRMKGFRPVPLLYRGGVQTALYTCRFCGFCDLTPICSNRRYCSTLCGKRARRRGIRQRNYPARRREPIARDAWEVCWGVERSEFAVRLPRARDERGRLAA